MKNQLAVLVVVLLVIASQASSQPLFGSPTIYSVGDQPRSVFSADLDGDLDNDLAVANLGSKSVSILLNKGDGTFVASEEYDAGGEPVSVFSVDLDGDLDNDLAVANSEPDSVSILLNNGDGTFAPLVEYYAGSHPTSIFSTDLDGDLDNDLAVTNYESDSVSILFNNGNGTFIYSGQYSAGDGPHSIFSADFDGINGNDLAVANRISSDVSILLNNGDSTFVLSEEYGVAVHPTTVFSADLNGDNYNDLAVTTDGDEVSILLNNGNGTFAASDEYGVGDHPNSVFSVDLDGDLDNDLAVSNYESDNVSILLNNGDGTFADSEEYSVDVYPHWVFSADFDGDGDYDLVTANNNTDNVSILFNTTLCKGGDILVYATADDMGKPYNRTYFMDLIEILDGWSVTVEDRTTIPIITSDILNEYDQFWLMSTDLELIEHFSEQEILDILDFRESGGGLLISADDEQVHNYQDDANQISIPLGVEFSGTVSHANHDCFGLSTIPHAVVANVEELYGTMNEGGMIILSPAIVNVIATAGDDRITAIRNDGLGRVVFDEAFVRFMNEPIHECDDSIYANNIAAWLQNCSGTSIIIEPNPIYAPMKYTYHDTLKADIYIGGNFGGGGHVVSAIDDATILVNGIIPENIELLVSYSGFIGEVKKIIVNMGDFIDSYPLLWDTDTYTYEVTGNFLAGGSFTQDDQVTMIGHISGDPNFDHEVNIFDITYLINFLYLGGPPPRPIMETGDINGDATINIFDISYLVSFLYLGGSPPTHP